MRYSSSDDFAARLKRLRQNCGYTQQQLADALSIHRSTYAYYELGRSNPPREILEKIVSIFNLSYDELLGNASEPRATRLYSGETQPESAKIYNLSKSERILLAGFRMMSEEEQESLIASVHEQIAAHDRALSEKTEPESK